MPPYRSSQTRTSTPNKMNTHRRGRGRPAKRGRGRGRSTLQKSEPVSLQRSMLNELPSPQVKPSPSPSPCRSPERPLMLLPPPPPNSPSTPALPFPPPPPSLPPVPCTRCAKSLFIQKPDGRVEGPLVCESRGARPCARCASSKKTCRLLPGPARLEVGRLQGLEASIEAVQKTKELAFRIDSCHRKLDEMNGKDPLLLTLRSINRNIFRLLNEQRELAGKIPLDDADMDDWEGLW